jgi:hypothetical protein
MTMMNDDDNYDDDDDVVMMTMKEGERGNGSRGGKGTMLDFIA